MFNRSYHIFEDYNIPFDEKGSSVGTIRRVQWVPEGKEPDESKAKLEIRKVRITPEGEELAKGYAFSTEEGPGELVVGLIQAGFGSTRQILKTVSKRKDFVEAVNTIDQDPDDESTGELFDMRNLLLSIDSSSEDSLEDSEDLDDAS